MADLGALRIAKQALDEGLIGPSDYDLVKIAFLKAQQIKAGLDAGFIRQGDYDKARDAYLHALDFSIMTTFPTSHNVQDHARAHAAPRTVSGPAAYVASESAAAGAGPSLFHNQSEPAAALQAAAVAAAPPQQQQYPAASPPRPPLAPTTEATLAAAAVAAAAAPPRQEPALPVLNPVRTFSQASVPSAGPSAPASAAASAAASASNTPRAGASGGMADTPDIPNYIKNMPHLDFTKVSMSGIGVKEECVNMFLHAKTRSAFKWIIYKVDDSGKYVVPEAWAGRGSTYAEFTAAMPERACRYAVYDYQLNLDGRGSHNKLVFVNWAPSDCPVRQKMMFASTKDYFKRFLDGIGAELQATERSELCEAEMKDKVLTYVGAGGKV